MNDWVNCLNTKLRELKVLSPKENIYSKPPAMRLLQSRNPRDPLPACPPNGESLTNEIPGLELIQSSSTTTHESQNRTTTSTTTLITSSTTTTQVESFTATTSISVNNNNEDDSENSNPISIPVFNFATSNTSSQNLINLLSNPLYRYASNNENLQFANNNFNDNQEDDDDDEEDDEEEFEENEEIEKELTNILPTSLNIEYVPESIISNENNGDALLSRDNNITIISVVANGSNLTNIIKPKIDQSKVTKIKIEVEYDDLSKLDVSRKSLNQNQSNTSSSSSSTSSAIQSKSHNSIEENKSNISSQIPSTSTYNNISECNAKLNVCNNTPKKKNPITQTPSQKSTPLHEKRKLSLREQQVVQLRHEINTEIRFKLRKKDCVDTIAFATYENKLWISGFKPNPQLYVFHIGDQLKAINNIANIKHPADAQKFIKMCAGLFVEVTILRLPLAGIYVVKREFENQCLGLIRDRSSLLDIIPNSIASRAAIPTRPPFSSQNDDDSILWIITEINFRPLSLISHKKYDETELLLNGVGLETSLLLQPSDFIEKMRKELKAMKNYRDYTLS